MRPEVCYSIDRRNTVIHVAMIAPSILINCVSDSNTSLKVPDATATNQVSRKGWGPNAVLRGIGILPVEQHPDLVRALLNG